MQTLTHGGDWMGYREQFGRDALDFSANVSPLGLPKGVADAITAALPQADRYPDPLCRTLRAALSEAEGLPAEQFLCGNGAGRKTPPGAGDGPHLCGVRHGTRNRGLHGGALYAERSQ